MRKRHLSLKSARKIALNAQYLDSRTKIPPGKKGVLQTIEKLGYVQIDTIAVIERAHHHTLWTRLPDYDPVMLHTLQAKDRQVFEYWGHAASYLPMSDYRYYLPRMHKYRTFMTKGARQRLERYGHLMGNVLERIRKEGPLGSKDFAPPPGKKRGTWWNWKPAKFALEILFGRGDLMVTERRNFQRIYDLTERVLPENTDISVPDDDELGRFLVYRALSAYGLALENEICNHIHAAGKEVIKRSLLDLVYSNEVVPLMVEGQNDTVYYALPEMIETAVKFRKKSPCVFLFSPFDNLIIQRNRIKHLFGFDYALECYLPASKRKYGYFTIPVFWGEEFAGRLDAKADRKKKRMIIRNLIFEPEFADVGGILPFFADKLALFAQFNQCREIKIEKVSPVGIKPHLKHLVGRAVIEV